MSQLSEKELSTLKDLLADEDLLVKKFKMLAEHATDTSVKNKMLEISVVAAQNGFPAEEYDFVIKHYLKIKHKLKKLLKKQVS